MVGTKCVAIDDVPTKAILVFVASLLYCDVIAFIGKSNDLSREGEKLLET